jgi:rubrerythrin
MVQAERLTNPYLSDIFKLFEGAMDLEMRAERFYLEAAEKVAHPEIKRFLRCFAADEARHRKFLVKHKGAVYNEGYWLGIEHVRLQT